MTNSLFHLAFPIHDVEAATRFYVDGLGCTLGRASERALTLGLAGHQLVGHLVPDQISEQKGIYPRHFGLIFLSQGEWQALADHQRDRLLGEEGVPHITFYR